MEGVLNKFASAFGAYNPIFQYLSHPAADAFGLKSLGPHFGVFVYSFVLFNLANAVLVPGLSRLLFNRVYGALDGKARNRWYVKSESGHVSFPETDKYPPECCRCPATTPHTIQELPWSIAAPRINRDPSGRQVPRFPRLICGSRVWLGRKSWRSACRCGCVLPLGYHRHDRAFRGFRVCGSRFVTFS